jgi:prophage maintenance system killer protein
MEWLTTEDLLLVAEVVLDVPGEQLAGVARLDAAERALAAAAQQADLAGAAAVLCERLVRDRPLPWGNKPVALVAMLELVARNHGSWTGRQDGGHELAAAIERLAAGKLDPAAFRTWIRARVRSGQCSRSTSPTS